MCAKSSVQEAGFELRYLCVDVGPTTTDDLHLAELLVLTLSTYDHGWSYILYRQIPRVTKLTQTDLE